MRPERRACTFACLHPHMKVFYSNMLHSSIKWFLSEMKQRLHCWSDAGKLSWMSRIAFLSHTWVSRWRPTLDAPPRPGDSGRKKFLCGFEVKRTGRQRCLQFYSADNAGTQKRRHTDVTTRKRVMLVQLSQATCGFKMWPEQQCWLQSTGGAFFVFTFLFWPQKLSTLCLKLKSNKFLFVYIARF